MTVVTGVVDAVSYLALGHVFVANMTGNVVFLGFALAGAGGLSVPASLVALAAFLCGAAAGGRIGARFGDRRFAHLRAANSVTATLLVAVAVLAAVVGQPLSSWQRYALVAAMALAMGVQNAMARSLAVPDLTTTVLTLTLTGVAADSQCRGRVGRPHRPASDLGLRDARRRADRRAARDPRRHRAAAGDRRRAAGGHAGARAAAEPDLTGRVESII
jgi:uncharacterized membrane protein YoaK (UPF0700 family)